MTASNPTPPSGESLSDVSDTQQCAFCANRWVNLTASLDELVECPKCGEEMRLAAARLLELTEDDRWLEIVDVQVPEEIADCVQVMSDRTGEPEGEILRHSLTVELQFELPGGDGT